MEREPTRVAPAREPGGAAAYVRATAIVAAATAAASAARALLHVPDAEMLFLLGVLVVALGSSRAVALYASLLSVAAYDFFFVPPPLTFEVEDARFVLTFALILGIGAVVSTLAARVRRQERAAREREARTEALYAASRGLGAALAREDVAEVCARAAAEALGAPAVFLLAGGGDELLPAAAAPGGSALSPAELGVARWTLLHGSPAGGGTGTFDEAAVLCLPLRPLVDVLAVLAVRVGAAPPREDQRAFLDALGRQAAAALERVRLGDEARRAALRADAEELRSTLLSSVSHDLRTPLAAITGAATTLRAGEALDPRTRSELLDAICDEAARLERLVGDLLDMTRLQSGAVAPRREWVPLEELVDGALERLGAALDGRAVTSSLGAGVPLLPVDPVLVQQLLVNVLENAAKYTPRGSPIEISAEVDGGAVVVAIADRGAGIPPGAEERIFERFRREGRQGGAGFGLGLAIARAIAVAHGGTLAAENRAGGGAVFRLRLPVGSAPPAAVEASP